MEHTVLTGVIILLAASVVGLAVFARLGLPALLAYLVVGVIVGPHGLSWLPHTADIHFLGEFGVVLLLFTIGLEFSLSQLWLLRKQVFGVGGAQVSVSAAVGGVLAWLFGAEPSAAFVLGGALALSSTAVVSRELARRDEIGQPHGRLSVSVLIFQDLAVVPFLILIPVLGGDADTGAWQAVMAALVQGALVVVLMLATGRWILRPLFRRLVAYGSQELFRLTALLFALAAAWVTEYAGLSLALGAFLAGAMLAETEHRQQLQMEIAPFRDVLLGLFFVVIGMMLDLQAVVRWLPWVLLALTVLLILKTLTTTLLGRMLGVPRGTAMHAGILLSQGGEFGLVLATLAAAEGLLDEAVVQVILATIILSIALTPLLARWAEPLSDRLCFAHGPANR